MRELTDILPTLQPPPGGLARLRHRLDAAPPRRWARHRFAWATAAAVALTLALVLPPVVQRQRATPLTRALLQHLSAPAGPTGIRVDNGAAIALPSHDPQVRVYLVETADAPAR